MTGCLWFPAVSSGARAILGTAAVRHACSLFLCATFADFRSSFGQSVVGYPLDIFKNYMKIGKITAPVAIAHGTVDEVSWVDTAPVIFAVRNRPTTGLNLGLSSLESHSTRRWIDSGA